MRDPYEVLGVGKNADAAAIKSAYRRLAKKLHPDANKNDPKTAQRFAELNSAYEIIGEEKKRRAYDAGEIDAEGKPRFQGFGGSARRSRAGRPLRDILLRAGGLPGTRRRRRRPLRGHHQPDVRRLRRRPHADVSGRLRIRRVEPAGHDVTISVTISLEEAAAGGTRRVRLPTGKEVDVKIPAGLADGKQIRLKGKGIPGPGGAGDVLIIVKIAPHAVFERDGTDLRTAVPIALYEAVLGGKVRVPTLGGAVELAIPPGTSGGRTFRLKGKGMTVDGKAGDLLITVNIALPEKGDGDLDELMKAWRDHKPYDPRRTK